MGTYVLNLGEEDEIGLRDSYKHTMQPALAGALHFCPGDLQRASKSQVHRDRGRMARAALMASTPHNLASRTTQTDHNAQPGTHP